MTSNMKILLVAAIACATSISSLKAADALADGEASRDFATREFAWDGSESLIVDSPADVRFIQAEGPGRVVVSGAARSIAKIRADGGVLRDARLHSGKPVQVVITAPKITYFSAKGGDKLTIENYDQTDLKIDATGRADIKAAGRATKVVLNLQGLGWADLSGLASEGAEVSVTGSRHALIAPASWAKLSGNGSVILVTRPQNVEAAMAESGKVIYAGLPPVAPPGM